MSRQGMMGSFEPSRLEGPHHGVCVGSMKGPTLWCFACAMAWAAAVRGCSDPLVSALAAARLLSAPRLAVIAGDDEGERVAVVCEVMKVGHECADPTDLAAFLGLLSAAEIEARRTWGCEGRYPTESLVADGFKRARLKREAEEETMLQKAAAPGSDLPLPPARCFTRVCTGWK